MTNIDIVVKAIDVYSSMHPRPAHVTLGQAAEMLGKSRPTVKKWLNEGRLKRNGCGLIPVVEIDRLLEPVSNV